MKIKLTESERLEMLKAWRTGVLDLGKIKMLKDIDKAFQPMSIDEAKKIIAEL